LNRTTFLGYENSKEAYGSGSANLPAPDKQGQVRFAIDLISSGGGDSSWRIE